MILPGVALAREVFRAHPGSRIAACLVGPALGLGFSVFGMFLLWAAGVQNWLAILLGSSLTWLLVVLARRFGGPSLVLPPFDRRDVIAVSLALLVVPVITWAPYDHVREPVSDGEAYRAYFTADFVWGMTVASELAKGDVPPANPFLAGAPLRYYWMSHMLSGALYRNVRGWGVTLEQVLLIDGLVFGLAAVAFFYMLARTAGGSAVFAALAVVVSFIANSYEGLERLWLLYHQGLPFDLVKTINIDAVTRWFYEGMPVDGLQRMLLYQPHHLTGYMLCLAALWLVGCARDVTETSVSLWAGILLGLGLLFSTFTAIIVGVAIALLFAVRLVQQHALGSAWQCIVLGGAPLALAVAVSSVLGYTDPAQGILVTFGLNPVAVRRWPLMLLLSFGPLLFAGIVGIMRIRWVGREGATAVTLGVAALLFYFTADVPDQGGVWVGWRSGHLLLIAFAVMGAAALTAAWRIAELRLPAAVVSALVIIPATPTVAIDIYNAQDVSNRGPGPGFPWTLIVSPPERAALTWLRDTTSPDAIVQFEPQARGAQWWCYLTAFAERRMAGGLPGSMIPVRPYQEASENIRLGIFTSANAVAAHEIAVSLRIDYLFVGPPERHWYRPAIATIAGRPDLFPQAFRNDLITIYAVKR